jgi:Pentapeptide repeats (8 copies)
MNNPTSRASRRVRFEEVTPAHEYAAFFSVSIAPLVAHLGLPIFDGYDDLDDLQLAFLTLPSGETVTLGEYAGMPGTSLYIEVTMQSIPQIIFDSCQQLRVSRQELEWVHPDRQVEFERLSAEYGEIEGIDRSSTAVLAQSDDREPIDCFYHALEIYTRPKFPEHWAMLQHNLGLAYFDRIKGERWENLQKSIECYHKSLEVFTRNKFSQKWQINQEDLSQSLEVWLVERQNLVEDILDRPRANRNLKYADLHAASLNNASLNNAILFDAKLSGAKLSGAGLRYANLNGADLIGTDLSYADLSYANLSYANLSYANLNGAILNGTILSDTTNVDKAQFGDNEGISELMRDDLRARGALFEDPPGDRSESRTLVPR